MRAIQRMERAIMNHMPSVVNAVSQGKSIGASISDWVALVIGLLVGVVMIPIIEYEVRVTNTSEWNFTGVTGAITLFRLMPFIFIAGVVVWFVGRLFGKW